MNTRELELFIFTIDRHMIKPISDVSTYLVSFFFMSIFCWCQQWYNKNKISTKNHVKQEQVKEKGIKKKKPTITNAL